MSEALRLPSFRGRPAARTALALGLMTWVTVSMAADIHVPADQPSIQAGIDAAVDGDQVLVAPGRYPESIDFRGKDIRVKATGGPTRTAIDPQRASRVVTFQSGEPSTAVLEGFEISGGEATQVGEAGLGGGILIAGTASPEIRRNLIGNNQSCGGGGIAVTDVAAPRIHDNEIIGNSAFCGAASGGGIYIASSGRVLVDHNRIDSNSVDISDGGGIFVVGDAFGHSHTSIYRNQITNNAALRGAGGGIRVSSDRVAIVDNLVHYNYSMQGDGILVVTFVPGAEIVIASNTVSEDQNLQRWGIEIWASAEKGGRVDIVNNIVTDALYQGIECGLNAVLHDNLVYTPNGETQVGCTVQGRILTDDPQFVRIGKGNHPFWLKSTSPAIDAGDDDAVRRDRFDITGAPRVSGRHVDLGAIEYRQE